mgnify:CR=1 FL=1
MIMALINGKRAYPLMAINQASATASGLKSSNKQYKNHIPHKAVSTLKLRFHSYTWKMFFKRRRDPIPKVKPSIIIPIFNGIYRSIPVMT